MTKDQLLAEVGRRLGDTSAAFRDTILAPAFGFVLRDLAQHEAIASVQRTAEFNVVAHERTYSTATICGLTLPPVSVEELVVYAWKYRGPIPEARPSSMLRDRRLHYGEDWRGPWQLWRLYPNPSILEVWPPADDEDAGVTATITYIANPAALSGGAEITEIADEDLETVVFGVKARVAHWSEDTARDAERAWLPYYEGRARMWGRRHNSRPGRIRPLGP